MMNHSEMMWRYAETMTRQARIDGQTCFTPPILSALAAPRTIRRPRILGFR